MKPPIHSLMAEFKTAEEILQATRRASQEGYRDMDAYTPYPVEGLAAELGLPRTRVPFVVLAAGLVGAGSGFFMQWYAAAIDYPINVGGRPLNSWPAFIQVTFEVMVLVASIAALFGMLFLNGLPRPHHPVFNVPRFDRASQDRFFLCIEARDANYDADATRRFLEESHPVSIVEVPS